MTIGESPSARPDFWVSFARAVGADPREHKVIIGASGLEHPVQLLAVDDAKNRVLIVSAEPNARLAALMQVDVQAAMPSTQIVIARPIVFDLGVLARQIFPKPADAIVDIVAVKDFFDRFALLKEARKQRYFNRQFGQLVVPVARAFRNVSLPAMAQVIDVIQQLQGLDWTPIFETLGNPGMTAPLSFEELRNIDNLAVDRKHGICPLPLYEFTDADWELFAHGDRVDEVQDRLRQLGIHQFFFPSPDRLALGIVERGIVDRNAIISAVERAPSLGHPFGPSELVSNHSEIPRLLEELREVGYLAEGEHGVEITPAGTTTRSVVKFRPQESVFQRLINRLNVNVSVSLKDLFPPSH
jgi:hypothetical protein